MLDFVLDGFLWFLVVPIHEAECFLFFGEFFARSWQTSWNLSTQLLEMTLTNSYHLFPPKLQPSGWHSLHAEKLQLPERVRAAHAWAMQLHGNLFLRPAVPAGSQLHAVPIARHDPEWWPVLSELRQQFRWSTGSAESPGSPRLNWWSRS